MKKRLLLVLLMFLICAAMTNTVRAAEEATVTVEPSTYTAHSIGDRFTVNVTVHNIYATAAHRGCWSWMVRLNWNASVLNVTSRADVVEGDFLKDVNPATFFLFWDPRPGELPELCNNFLVEEEAEGNGTLVTITFTAIGLGVTNITIYETDFIDFSEKPIPVTTQKGNVIVIPEFPTSIILPLFLITTATIAILAKTIWSRTRRGYINAP